MSKCKMKYRSNKLDHILGRLDIFIIEMSITVTKEIRNCDNGAWNIFHVIILKIAFRTLHTNLWLLYIIYILLPYAIYNIILWCCEICEQEIDEKY